MYTKQKLAFRWSAERLRETTGHLYLWTFTFRHVYDAWQYPSIWKKFSARLETRFAERNPYGIRVLQVHPGHVTQPGGHGLHYHCLFNKYLETRKVWALCKQFDMGCDAKKVHQTQWESIVSYVSRYLTRDEDPLPGNCGLRRVGSMWGFPMVSISDIEVTSSYSDSVAYLTKLWGRGTFGREQINAIYNSVNTLGDYRTLLCGLHYKYFGSMSAFKWTEKTCAKVVRLPPYNSWINVNSTIYQPGYLPCYLSSEIPF